MSLTLGTGPFGPHPAGSYNFERVGPKSVLYWEDFPKRVRVEFNGAFIADSRRVKALHETGHMMVFYFPREDVDMGRLTATERHTICPYKGKASYWSVQVGDRIARNAVWSYAEPKPSTPPIKGYMAFDYPQMDAWYQEDEKIFAHPRDPYHRFDVHASSRHVVVRHGDRILADSHRPQMLFETSLPPVYYLPSADVHADLLQKSDTISQCPYKGEARHWHLVIGNDRVENAAWSYPDPLGEAKQIADCFSFYPKKVQIEVDGEPLG